jgi:ribosomal protein S18 acetylase RimI-like enzyme
MIKYQIENNISPKEFKELLLKSTLGERRPVDDFERIKAMVQHANLIVTARDKNKLVGVARSISDFVYCTYLSDLAVDTAYQKKGIGKELIRLTKEETPKANLILLSAPKAVDYYQHIGMSQHQACFVLNDSKDLK